MMIKVFIVLGGLSKVLLDFDRMYKGTKKYFIEQTFESTPEIVALANRFIKTNSERFNKELRTENPSGPKLIL